MIQTTLQLTTKGRGTTDITQLINDEINKTDGENGLCHLFIPHTSASLMTCENYDPQVRKDLETFFKKIVPDGDPMFKHTSEGPDDMPAHVRSILTQSSLSIPIMDGQLSLGTWQGIYLYEHRAQGHNRNVILSIHT